MHSFNNIHRSRALVKQHSQVSCIQSENIHWSSESKYQHAQIRCIHEENIQGSDTYKHTRRYHLSTKRHSRVLRIQVHSRDGASIEQDSKRPVMTYISNTVGSAFSSTSRSIERICPSHAATHRAVLPASSRASISDPPFTSWENDCYMKDTPSLPIALVCPSHAATQKGDPLASSSALMCAPPSRRQTAITFCMKAFGVSLNRT